MDADTINTLVAKAQAEALGRRQAAADELRRLLLQQGKPSGDDEKRIADALEVLGIRADELPAVLEVVQKLANYEALMADLPNRIAAVGAAHMKLAEFDAAAEVRRQQFFDEMAAKRLPLAAAESRALGKQYETREAQQWVSTYRAKWQGIIEGISHEEILERNRPHGTPHGAPTSHQPQGVLHEEPSSRARQSFK
jgi:hypothetical protein